MSKYENYDRISLTYDETRTAVGIERVLDYLPALGKPPDALTILDAGCGTGNYTRELIGHAGRVVGCDLSRGMLRQAKTKVRNEAAVSRLVQADLSALPFGDGVFDAICCNQVVHHLDEPGTGMPNQRRFFEAAFRTLKPDGVLIINTIAHEQLRDGVWWGELIAPAVQRMTARFASLGDLESLLADCGFGMCHHEVPFETIIQRNGYFDYRSLRKEAFRNGDSHFSLLTPEELDQMLGRLDQLESSGTIERYIEERDILRQQVGQFTLLMAHRESAPLERDAPRRHARIGHVSG